MIRLTRRRKWIILLVTLAAAVGAVFDVSTLAVDGAWRAAEWAARPFIALRDEARQRWHMTEIHATRGKFWDSRAARCMAGECAVRPIPESERSRDSFGYFPAGTTLYELDDQPPGTRGRTAWDPGTLDPETSAASCRALAEFHRAMERKWRWAARTPWTRVEDDPPGPPLVYEPGPRDESF